MCVAILLLVPIVPVTKVAADVSPCEAFVTTNSLSPSSQTVLNFNITNTDVNNDIKWIRILKPSGDYQVVSAVSDLWTNGANNDEANFTDGSIEPGGSQTIGVEVVTQSNQSSYANWSIYVSDEADGLNSVACNGQLATRITSQAPFAISGVSVEQTTANSTVIKWLTNYPSTSRVVYGKTVAYGQTTQVGGTTMNTSHTVQLTNLESSTTYHFKVVSQSADNQTIESSDNTLQTKAPTPQQSAPSLPAANGSNVVAPTVFSNPFLYAKSIESEPPKVTIGSLTEKVYKSVPRITGSVSDNDKVALVEYSIDGGLNWLPVDNSRGLGTAVVSYDFVPKNVTDGNYELVVRATDASKNTAQAIGGTIVIDTMPPLPGAYTVTLGAQSLVPSKDGLWNVIAGIDHQITLNAVGGATAIEIGAYLNNEKQPSQIFHLTRSNTTGLWSGAFSLQKAGVYQLKARSIDGAQNKIDKDLGKFIVKSKGKILDTSSGKPIDAAVTVYGRDQKTGTWHTVTPSDYNQSSQTSANEGMYGLYLLPGSYYFRFEKSGYVTRVTDIVTLSKFGSVSPTIHMHKTVGPFGWFQSRFSELLPQKVSADKEQSLLNQKATQTSLPIFNLPLSGGGEVKTVNYYGHPTIVSFVNTWAPYSDEQLAVLEKVASEYPEMRVLPIVSGESVTKVAAFNVLADRRFPVAVDSTNAILYSLPSSAVMTHYFVDRRGTVINHAVGLLSKEEIVKSISN